MTANTTLHIRGPDGNAIPVAVDITAELMRYDWEKARWTSDRLVAVSPFRYDKTPSFYVYTEDTASARAGDWGDAGAADTDHSRGGFVRLIAFLDRTTTEEAAEYLLAKYSAEYLRDTITLTVPRLRINAPKVTDIKRSILAEYSYRSPYLETRGISEAVQRLCEVGYDRKRRAVTIPWFNADGSLANVKYRRVDSKAFWYAKGGRPIGSLIYGINVVYNRAIKRAVIVEAEVDAMTLMSVGIPAVATGGSNFNAVKRDIIVRSPLEEIVVIRDNDAAGRAWQRKVIAELAPYLRVKVATVSGRYKDVNEAHMNGADIAAYVRRARRTRTGGLLSKFVEMYT
jgi:DNA primase